MSATGCSVKRDPSCCLAKQLSADAICLACRSKNDPRSSPVATITSLPEVNEAATSKDDGPSEAAVSPSFVRSSNERGTEGPPREESSAMDLDA